MESSSQQKKLRLLFSHISELIISPDSVDIVMAKIMQEVEKFFKPTNWSILRYDPAADELFFAYAKGLDHKIIRNIRLKKGEGIAGMVVETGKSSYIKDCQKDPRFSGKVDKAFGQKTRSIIAAPIKFKDITLGVLELINLESHDYFSDEDLFVLEIIANFAAIALINAMLFENMVNISHHDPLTGVYNRTKLDEILKKWAAEPHHYTEREVTVFLLDLNGFKEINDQWGHHEGDKTLKETTQLIVSGARRRDLFFRIGGDEFLYLAVHDDVKKAHDTEQVVLQRLEKISRELEPRMGRFSIGFKTGRIRDIKSLIDEADKVMYLDKEWRKAHYEK